MMWTIGKLVPKHDPFSVNWIQEKNKSVGKLSPDKKKKKNLKNFITSKINDIPMYFVMFVMQNINDVLGKNLNDTGLTNSYRFIVLLYHLGTSIFKLFYLIIHYSTQLRREKKNIIIYNHLLLLARSQNEFHQTIDDSPSELSRGGRGGFPRPGFLKRARKYYIKVSGVP